MPTIRQLPPSVVNKIAAGEVIERPGSVVKELMENALDAGATRVDVSIERGGNDLIRVADNGCGIEAEQLPLAVSSHATSKLTNAEDLFCVGTLGFRGEALASMAEVSRMTIRSRTRESLGGAEQEVHGGKASEVSPCGCPIGTTVEVRQLFFNTPVRRKFLKSVQTEFGHISEAFTRLALPHPQIHFTLQHNGRMVYDLPPSDDWLSRIAALLGRDLADHLLWVESVDEPVRLRGYVAHPSQSRSHSRMQYLFLNGRHIRDRALQHALAEAYRGILTVGRSPICCLSLSMPAEYVDVNVHPTKLEVRFQEGGRHYSQLLSTLRTRFLSSNLTHHIPEEPEPAAEAAGTSMDQRASDAKQELMSWVNSQLPTAGPNQVDLPPIPNSPAEEPHEPLKTHQLPPDWPLGNVASVSPVQQEPSTAPPSKPSDPSTYIAPNENHSAALQVGNRYLVTGEQENLVIIDQHALHERILYEQLRERVLAGKVESQRLLVPEPVELSAQETGLLLDQQPLLAELGIEIEAFGESTVLVSRYPAMLKNLTPREIVHEVVSLLLSGGKRPERRDLIDSILHSMSCKAAIKAGDKLGPEEISSLLAQRHLAQDAHHCPHGRPTTLVLSREQLDKHFKRI